MSFLNLTIEAKEEDVSDSEDGSNQSQASNDEESENSNQPDSQALNELDQNVIQSSQESEESK